MSEDTHPDPGEAPDPSHYFIGVSESFLGVKLGTSVVEWLVAAAELAKKEDRDNITMSCARRTIPDDHRNTLVVGAPPLPPESGWLFRRDADGELDVVYFREESATYACELWVKGGGSPAIAAVRPVQVERITGGRCFLNGRVLDYRTDPMNEVGRQFTLAKLRRLGVTQEDLELLGTPVKLEEGNP